MSPLLRHHANMPQVVRESVCAGQGGRLTEVGFTLHPHCTAMREGESVDPTERQYDGAGSLLLTLTVRWRRKRRRQRSSRRSRAGRR
jgi:hypothetical protein